jgi:S1-C subfamily serine protease
MRHYLLASFLLFGITAPTCTAQEPEKSETVPTAVQWTLDAAGPTQRAAIKSVVLLFCPESGMKGTGFVLSDGLVVTNNHVVEGCTADELMGNPLNQQQGIRFSKMATDKDVDLALLRPTKILTGGLELGSDQDPRPGTSVTTWGFPLIYNGPAPLLSVGYVAGYSKDTMNGKGVKHIVVNGAFNPGNSGGPLFLGNSNKVIGVVVAKFHLYPPIVQQAIQALSKSSAGVVYTGTDEHGQPRQYLEGEVTAMVLDQFYKTTQVMIGEAISVSELRAFLDKKRSDVQ